MKATLSGFLSRFGRNLTEQFAPIALGIARIVLAGDYLGGVGLIVSGVAPALSAALKPEVASKNVGYNRPTPAIFLATISRDFVAWAMVLGAAVFVVGLQWHVAWAACVGAALWFTAFDAAGWGHVRRDDSDPRAHESMVFYRVQQNVLHHTLGYILFFHVSWAAGAGFYLLWIAGALDLLYYFLLTESVPEELPWIYWTVPGWFGLTRRTPLVVSSLLAVGATVALFVFS